MAFTEKKISITFELANGQFESTDGKSGGNTMTVAGLRVTADIVNAGAGYSTCEMAVYGLPLKVMNQLSVVGTQNKLLQRYKNGLTVTAGDSNGMHVVFKGVIYMAFVDAQAMPEVAFRVFGSPGSFAAVKPTQPTSVAGTVDASRIEGTLAKQMGFEFEDAGVQSKLSNPYYPGTAWTQAHQIAKHGGFNIIHDRGTMVILPPGKSRQGDTVLISPQTGLVGYPMFAQAQILLQALFNPAVKPQGLVEVKSDLTPACGIWRVNRLEYVLESVTPNGRWFMNIEGVMQQDESPT